MEIVADPRNRVPSRILALVFSNDSCTLHKLYYFRLETYCLVLSNRFLEMKMQPIIAVNIIVMSENHTD